MVPQPQVGFRVPYKTNNVYVFVIQSKSYFPPTCVIHGKRGETTRVDPWQCGSPYPFDGNLFFPCGIPMEISIGFLWEWGMGWEWGLEIYSHANPGNNPLLAETLVAKARFPLYF